MTQAVSPEAVDLPPGARASGSSFYMAMRILPRAQRAAMFEIYSFCRQVDDIADSNAPRGLRLRLLDQWRAGIDAIYAGKPPARLAALAQAVADFRLARQDFLDVIDGMEMDAETDIRAPDFATLDVYCDRVASGVGRLSVRVFGMERDAGIALAHHLGRALQLTNILRDIDEDAALGRLYLPREALESAGIHTTDPQAAAGSAELPRVCIAVVARAREHYAEAEKIMATAPRRAVRAPRIMYEVYRAIFDALIARGWSSPRHPVRLAKARLAWIVLRHAFL